MRNSGREERVDAGICISYLPSDDDETDEMKFGFCLRSRVDNVAGGPSIWIFFDDGTR